MFTGQSRHFFARAAGEGDAANERGQLHRDLGLRRAGPMTGAKGPQAPERFAPETLGAPPTRGDDRRGDPGRRHDAGGRDPPGSRRPEPRRIRDADVAESGERVGRIHRDG